MSPGQPDTSFAFFSGVTCQESVHYIINQEEEIENTHYRLFLTQIPAYYSGLLGMFKWQLYKSALCVPACRFETACRRLQTACSYHIDGLHYRWTLRGPSQAGVPAPDKEVSVLVVG